MEGMAFEILAYNKVVRKIKKIICYNRVEL